MKYYVLHSPYPDKSWRGIEKCVSTPGTSGAPALFESKANALAFAKQIGLSEFVPVEVELTTPGIRKPISYE